MSKLTKKISYETKIQMLDADDIVKSKARDKLKEIFIVEVNGNAKAQQYLNGLLSIPLVSIKKMVYMYEQMISLIELTLFVKILIIF